MDNNKEKELQQGIQLIMVNRFGWTIFLYKHKP